LKNHGLTGIALIACLALTVPLQAAAGDSAGKFVPGSMANGAPPELAQWGKLVGRWSTTEESLQQDGSGWAPSAGADWDFMWAFDGWGIQDNYTSPPHATQLDDESTRQRGINLRIFNPAEKKWVLTWLTPTSVKPATFTAVSTDTDIVMFADVLNPQGYHRQITFFDMTDQAFEWKLEWSKDNETWFEVHRIHGERKSD
jgi:hypothetical protein